MIETFKCYFTKLEQLSREELVQSAEKLVLVENTTIAKLIAHLAEMSARKIALEKKDPKKKLERRRKRQGGAVASSRSNEMGKKDEPAQSRYVASKVSERGSYRN